MPPVIHTANTAAGPGSLSATPAGVRKMPDPIVDPMTMATADHRPSCLVSPALVGAFMPKTYLPVVSFASRVLALLDAPRPRPEQRAFLDFRHLLPDRSGRACRIG